MAKKNLKKITEELVNELLIKLVVDAKAEVLVEETKEEKTALIKINSTEDIGLLIGKHGDTLASLEKFVAISLKQATGEWVRVSLEIGDWKEKQVERLRELAEQAASRAVATGEPQHLYNLKPNERREIHMILADRDDVVTESYGEGYERYLVVSTKSK